MSSNPRNPYYFPKIKVRGARRHRLAPWQRMSAVFKRLGESAAAATETMRVFVPAADHETTETGR